MTRLHDQLVAEIKANGPISIAAYMQTCLLHPTMGYYATRDPLGTKGDFTTAPEISQMFGELIGLCLAQAWLDQGQPHRISLAELGPGRGTLMADILRATRGVPGFHAAMSVHMVEASPVLRALQAKAVPQAIFHDSVDGLPDAPLYLVANEFFDALPIRQFIRAGGLWRERVVGVENGQLAFGLTDAAPIAVMEHRLADTEDGDLVEYCPPLGPIVSAIDARIATQGGAALVIDYGDWQSQGDTLQALSRHSYADPLTTAGEADLTAHVDFAEIARHATTCNHTRLTPQGVFLERLGITARAEALAKTLAGSALENHIAAHRRLTHPAEMGDLFKVIGLTPKNAPAPAGLNP